MTRSHSATIRGGHASRKNRDRSRSGGPAPSARGSGIVDLAIAGFLTLLVAHAFRGVPAYALVGWDTFPIIASSRVESWADLLDLIREPLMAGYNPYVTFFRPVGSASFALGWAASGLSATGYHVTDLALHAANVLLVYAVGRRLLESRTPAALGAALFAIHPVHWETLPVPDRRFELLVLMFGLAAVLVRERGWRLPAAGLLVLALASKESGLAFVPVLLARELAGTGGRGARRKTVILAVALVLFVGAYLSLWFGVSGGLGGYVEDSRRPDMTLDRFGPLVTKLLIMPYGPLGAGQPLALLGAGLLVGGSICAWRTGLFRQEAGRPAWGSGAGSLAILWLGLIAIYALFGVDMLPWYAYVPVAPLCLITGWIAAHSFRCLLQWSRETDVRTLLIGLPGATVTAVLAIGWAWQSPLVSDRPEFRYGSSFQNAYLSALDDAIERARPGSTIVIRPTPGSVRPVEGEDGLMSVLLLTDYTVQAYCDLRWPGRGIVVRSPDDDARPAGSGATRVLFVPGTIRLPRSDLRSAPPPQLLTDVIPPR